MLKIFLSVLLLVFSQIMHAEETDITMLFVGDVMVAEKPGQLIAQGRDPFRYVQSLFRSADIRIGNLECAVSHKGKAEDKTYTFRAHPRVITTLKKYFDAVSVANNHAGDFGPVAFADMLYQLEKKQLAYFGGGRTLRAAHEPYLTTVKGKKIAVLGYDGFFPRSFEALEELPAVGHKTASVVMSQAFGVPAFPVDTHIHRLMYRWNLTNGKNVVQTEKDAKRIFPEELWNDLHLQIIWYGREYSPARGWDIEKDIITKTIGRKSVLSKK